MKRIFAIIFLAAFAVVAFCQEPNKQLRQLEKYLNEQGYEVKHSQSNAGGKIAHVWTSWQSFGYLTLPEGWSVGEERSRVQNVGVHRVKQEKMIEMLDTARHAFSTLSKEASESYCYEYHKSGTDTIKYAMAICNDVDTLSSFSHEGTKYFFNAQETANFDYTSRTFENEIKGLEDSENKKTHTLDAGGFYQHYYSIPSEYGWDDMQPFDTTAFKALIKPVLKKVLKLKGAKSSSVYWRHDEGCKPDGLWRQSFVVPYGLTTGTMYYIPAEHAAEVDLLCRELDSLAYHYVNSHPEQPYEYTYYDRPIRQPKEGNHGTFSFDIVNGVSYKGGNEYYLMCGSDDSGFYILSLINRGAIWIPYDWLRLKSWINGEKVYLKGREPKEDKNEKMNE